MLAAEPVVWRAMPKRAMAGPAPLLAAAAKAGRAPTPARVWLPERPRGRRCPRLAQR